MKAFEAILTKLKNHCQNTLCDYSFDRQFEPAITGLPTRFFVVSHYNSEDISRSPKSTGGVREGYLSRISHVGPRCRPSRSTGEITVRLRSPVELLATWLGLLSITHPYVLRILSFCTSLYLFTIGLASADFAIASLYYWVIFCIRH